MTHRYQTGALFDCEWCGDEYEDHPLAFAPHLCPRCEDDEEAGAWDLEMQDRWNDAHNMGDTGGGK